MRGKTVIRARPETFLQPGDRLLMIAPEQAQAELLVHLAPPSVSAAQALRLPVPLTLRPPLNGDYPCTTRLRKRLGVRVVKPRAFCHIGADGKLGGMLVTICKKSVAGGCY